MASIIRQNYHETCEGDVNKQINLELYASYVYLSMSYFFDRDDISLPGMSKMFKEESDEEREHAETLMKFQNKRGGRIVLEAVAAPAKSDWGTALDALKAALALEKKVNQALLDMHKNATDKVDAHMTDFIESEYLHVQVATIKKLGDLITQVNRAGPKALGEYLFDKHQQ